MKNLLRKIGELFLLLALAFISFANGSTFTVNTTNDTPDLNLVDGLCLDAAGNCSLRAAISQTNRDSNNTANRFHTINLPAGIYTLTLPGANEQGNAGGDLDILANSNMTINGDNARTTIIQAGTIKSTNGTDGNAIDRVIHCFQCSSVTLNNLTIRNGKGPVSGVNNNQGGGIFFFPALVGVGTLTINNSAIVDNYSFAHGGGIASEIPVNITNSLVAGNKSVFQGGGISENSFDRLGMVNAVNTTISGNSAGTYGGGISYRSAANLTNCTITGNSVATSSWFGGGLGVSDSATISRLRNTIVAGNSSPGVANDIAVGNGLGLANIVSGGTNLIGNSTGSTGWDGTDLLNNASANLGALANNGGPTDTHAVPTGSSALNAGQNCVIDSTCATFNALANVTTDQRGENRLSDGFAPQFALFVDIGAYERLAPSAANVSVSGRVLTPEDRGLRNAIVTLTDSEGQIKFARSSTFGYFRFEDILAGQNYVISVQSKSYRFAPQIIFIDDHLNNLNLTAISEDELPRKISAK